MDKEKGRVAGAWKCVHSVHMACCEGSLGCGNSDVGLNVGLTFSLKRRESKSSQLVFLCCLTLSSIT